MLQRKLDKTKPFKIITGKRGIRYEQNRTYFNCGGIAVSGDGVSEFRERKSYTVSLPGHGRTVEEHIELVPVEEELVEEPEEEPPFVEEPVVEAPEKQYTVEAEHVYTCDECGKEYSSNRGLILHQRRMHPEIMNGDDVS